MDFELGTAILAGLIAGAVMEGPVYVQRAMGLPVRQDIFRTWGQNLLGIGGAAGYVAGFLFHQGIAVLAAVLYALSFDLVGAHDDLWLWGLAGGVVHFALAGPVVGMIPSSDAQTGEVGGQGFAYRNYGARDVMTSFMGHLIFGLSTGILYGLLHAMGGSGVAF